MANAFSRVDCTSNPGAVPEVTLSVDLFGMPSANLTVTQNDNTEYSYFYFLRPNHFGMYLFTFWTGDFALRIDTWPDNEPVFGFTYPATLRTSKVQNGDVFDELECSFSPFSNSISPAGISSELK